MTEKFYDENGREVEFTIVGKFEVDDTSYAVLNPLDYEDMTYILKICVDENGDEYLEGIDDEELEMASAAYEELLESGEENGPKH